MEQITLEQIATPAALVQVKPNGTLCIYRYSGSGTFTGWLRCALAVPFSNV